MHLGIVTGCFHWRWAIIAANYLLSVLTIEAKHLIHFSLEAILETGLEQPHLTVGFFWKPGAFMRVAPPSEKVCCHPNGQDRFTWFTAVAAQLHRVGCPFPGNATTQLAVCGRERQYQSGASDCYPGQSVVDTIGLIGCPAGNGASPTQFRWSSP